jgi:preprotein translocase subunit SecF
MELFGKLNIDFIGKRFICYGISIVLMVGSLAAIFIKGPLMSIEFTGGTLLQVGFQDLPDLDKVRDVLNKDGWDGFNLQTQPSNHTLIVRVRESEKNKDQDDIATRIMATLKKEFSGNVKELPERVEYVGPIIGRKLALNAFLAILGSLAVIVIYVAFQFKNWIWGVVGVLALAHDVLITFGMLVLFQREIDLVVIAALLTLAGYSINDTIVIFDRVRENLRTTRKESLKDLYNRSVNETLGRTVNTAFMALMAAGSLLLGGEVIRNFALAMTFGVIIGSYSTIGVAISLIHQWEMARKA